MSDERPSAAANPAAAGSAVPLRRPNLSPNGPTGAHMARAQYPLDGSGGPSARSAQCRRESILDAH